MRAGVIYPPKAAACAIDFTSQDPLQPWNMNAYQLLGTMTAEHFKGSWDDALKRAVQEKACSVGADVAAINIITVNSFNGVQTANIMIYRRRYEDSASRNAAASVPAKNI